MNIQEEINQIQAQMRPLMQRLDQLNHQLRKEKSAEWIRVNNVRLSDVELSSGDDKPWFGMVSEFANWLKDNSTKRYAEWNDRIYHTSDLVAGRLPDMPATIDDITP